MNKKIIIMFCILLLVLINGCANANKIGAPGESKEAITVAASTHDNTIIGFSSRGPSRFGYSKPDVSAPGHLIIAARSQGTNLGNDLEASYGQFYTRISGTSMATPQVAGAAAILIQAYKDIYGTKPSPEAIKAALMKSSDDLYIEDLQYAPLHQGAGIINIEKALDLISTLAPYMASSPDIWYPKKLTTITDRETNLGEPMFLPGLIPGDFVFQKFVIIPSQSLPNVEIRTTTSWITINNNNEFSLGNVDGNQQPEFTAYLNIPDGAEPGDYNEKITIHSDDNLLLSIPVKINLASQLGEITSKLEFTAQAAPETNYYAFKLPQDSFLLELNLTTACEHMNAYLHTPSQLIYDYEDRDYYGDFTKEWDGSKLTDYITVENPPSNNHILALSSNTWGTQNSVVKPMEKCDTTPVEGTIKVYSTKITPLSIRSVVEEDTEQIHEIKIENKGAELNDINITSYCGDDISDKTKDPYLLEFSESLAISNFNFAGNEGYITIIPIEIAPGIRSLSIDVSQTGDHPTCAELYNPDNQFILEACNSPLEPAPRTTNSLSFTQLLKPKTGEWTLKLFNSDWSGPQGDYFGGQEEIIVDINKVVGLPCKSINIIPNSLSSIHSGQEAVLEATVSYPKKAKQGEITISTSKKDFRIPLSIIPKKASIGGSSELTIDEESWSYLWMDIPSNAETTHLVLNKTPGTELTAILNAELTKNIGEINSIILPDTSSEKYTEREDIAYTDGVNGNSNDLVILTDENTDGNIQLEEYGSYSYLTYLIDSDQDGFIELEFQRYSNSFKMTEDTDNDGYLTTEQEEEIYVDELSPVNNYGLGRIWAGELPYFVILESAEGNIDEIYIDFDMDYNLTDETPLSVGDEYTLGSRKFRITQIYVWENKEGGGLIVAELKDLFVGAVSPINEYAIGTGYIRGPKTVLIPKEESGYADSVYIDIDEDMNITNNNPLAVGDLFNIEDETYKVKEIETDEELIVVTSKVRNLIVGSLSPVNKYVYADYYSDGYYRLIIPLDSNNEFFEPVYVDYDRDDNLTDEIPINIGDNLTNIDGYKVILYNVDKGTDSDCTAEEGNWCEDKRVYFGIEGIEKTLDREGYNMGYLSLDKETDVINKEEDIFLVTDYDQNRLYLDFNKDKDFNDADEGPFNFKDTLKINDIHYKFSDKHPLTLKGQSSIQEHTLKLNPVLWKLSVKGKDLDSDKGQTLIGEGINQETVYSVNIENIARLTLAEIIIQNLESTPPVIKNPIYYSLTVRGTEILRKQVDFFGKLDLTPYLIEGENQIIISILDENHNPASNNHRLYYHEVSSGEMNLILNISHNLLPVDMSILLDKDEIDDFDDLNITFTSFNSHDEDIDLDCDLTIKNEVGTELDKTPFDFTIEPAQEYTQIFDDFSIRGDAADYYAIASCSYDEKTLTDIRKFTITKNLPVRMTAFVNKNVIVTDDPVLTYNISILKLREQAISGTLEIIAEKDSPELITSKEISLPYDIETDLILGLDEGSYNLIFRFISEFGYQIEKIIPITILAPEDSKDTDNDGVIDAFDDDQDDDGIPNEDDKLKGNKRNVRSNINNLKLFIDDNDNLKRAFNSQSRAVFKKNQKTLVDFSYDFSSKTLDLTKVEIKQDTDTSHGSLLINGIDVIKTVYIDDVDENLNSVCIKDAVVPSFDAVSDDCKGAGESLVECNNLPHGVYQCEDLGDTYKISGISHSAIVESSAPPPPPPPPGGGDDDDDDDDGGSSGGTSGIMTKRINMDLVDEILLRVGRVSRIIMTYKDDRYVLDVMRATDRFIAIRYNRRTVDIDINADASFNLDGDGKPDIRLQYKRLLSNRAEIVLSRITQSEGQETDVPVTGRDEPESPELPSGATNITEPPDEAPEEKDQGFNSLLWLLLPLSTLLVFIIVAAIILPKQRLYKKFSNTHKLEAYIIEHLHKGYAKEQIKTSLKYTGWPEDVIDHIFEKISRKR